MIIHNVIQGSPEWRELRLGIPTASEFERLITPKEWKPTKGETRRKYKVELLTELILGRPLDLITTASMQHGTDWEAKARAAYEMVQGVEVQQVGFCTDDAALYGASPDGFVGDDGGCEIKCPDKPEIHVGYMLYPDLFKQEYFVQTQGQLYVTRRKWTDLISYFSGFDMVTVRIEPVPEFQEKLGVALKTFVVELAAAVAQARAAGWIKAPEERAESGADFLTGDDAELIIAGLKKEGKL